MFAKPLGILPSAVLLLASAVASAQKFTSTTHTVPVYVTVTGEDRRLISNLLEEDFEVYDNGRKQTVTQFDNRSQPISVIVMLDTSGSMTLSLHLVKAAAEQFLIRLLPDDHAMVGAFNDKIQFLPADGFTSDRDRLVAQLKDLDFGYPTRLYDAVHQSLATLKPREERRVVLVFTDGEDTASTIDRDEVLDRARDDDVMVYAIGLENVIFTGQQRRMTRVDRALKKLAEETGGGFFLIRKTDDLGPTFTKVAQELRSQYLLGFSPAALDGKVHKLDIRVKKPGVSVRARRTYVATTDAVVGANR